MKTTRFLILLSLSLSLSLLTVPLSAAQDVLTIGNGTSCQVYPVGTTVVTVPVYIRDVTGTPLGRDKPAGKKLQAFSLQVTPNPASKIAVDSYGRLQIYPAQAGKTSGLSPTYSNNTNNTFSPARESPSPCSIREST